MARLPGLDTHPHAAAVLGSALEGNLSHAYLLAGPAGCGKRTAARAFAAELLAEGAKDPENARTRVQHGAHPDLTWVTPSGAHVMLRSDVAEAVVAAASHTPFEAQRRIFVLERVDTMNDEAANTLLKTLEEPPPYVVLLLLTDRPGQVLPTITSRCQPVRFDALPEATLVERLVAEGVDAAVARACARLSLGDGERALRIAREPGLREAAERLARSAITRTAARTQPWRQLLAASGERGAEARGALESARDEELEMLPKKERKRRENEYEDSIKRADRRARTGAIDHALQLTGLWFRDLACVASGAPELAHNADRSAELASDAAGRSTAALREAVALVEDTRARLALNVSEELALEALAYRLERCVAVK
jgi:DNA polymerase-3 subunit delta'